MRIKLGRTATTLLAATGLAMGLTLTTGVGTASAVPSFASYSTGNGRVIEVYHTDGSKAGEGEWIQDPVDGRATGDTLLAWDQLADGYGIEAHLSTGRVASTRGLPANTVIVETGNLPEGNTYSFWVCLVKGDYESCSGKYTVTA